MPGRWRDIARNGRGCVGGPQAEREGREPEMVKTDALKRMMLSELPPVLVVHLKRFGHSKAGPPPA